MECNNESIGDARMKRVGTREEVFKGQASRTAGGLKKDDIIAKQFGTRTLYISKRLSDRMRENFQNTTNNFRKRVRKTLVTPSSTSQSSFDIRRISTGTITGTRTGTSTGTITSNIKTPHSKTLKFKVNNNTVRNVYYKELQGMNIQKLKDELKKEESEEDLGMSSESAESRVFKIEDVPEISLDDLE